MHWEEPTITSEEFTVCKHLQNQQEKKKPTKNNIMFVYFLHNAKQPHKLT